MSFFDAARNKHGERGKYGMDIIVKNLMSHLATVIFGSHNIERAGLGLEETIKICEQIFRESIEPENIPGSLVTRPLDLCSRHTKFFSSFMERGIREKICSCRSFKATCPSHHPQTGSDSTWPSLLVHDQSGSLPRQPPVRKHYP